MKRLLALLWTLFMLITLLAACAGQKSKPSAESKEV